MRTFVGYVVKRAYEDGHSEYRTAICGERGRQVFRTLDEASKALLEIGIAPGTMTGRYVVPVFRGGPKRKPRSGTVFVGYVVKFADLADYPPYRNGFADVRKVFATFEDALNVASLVPIRAGKTIGRYVIPVLRKAK